MTSIKMFCDYCGYLALQLTKSAVSNNVLKDNFGNIKLGAEILRLSERLIYLSYEYDSQMDDAQKRRNACVTAYEMLAAVRHGQVEFTENTKGVSGYDLKGC